MFWISRDAIRLKSIGFNLKLESEWIRSKFLILINPILDLCKPNFQSESFWLYSFEFIWINSDSKLGLGQDKFGLNQIDFKLIYVKQDSRSFSDLFGMIQGQISN